MTTVRIVSRPAAAAAALAVVAAVAVSACSSGGPNASAIASILANASFPPAATTAPTSPPSEAAAASGAPSGSTLPTAVPTDIDPCQLITSADASALTGATFGPGKESDNGKNVKMCTYAAPGPQIFSVEVAIAPDAATAQAAKADTEADLQSNANDLAKMHLTVTELPNFADNTDAALMQGSLSAAGQSIGARAMFVLRNTTFFGFSDIVVNQGTPPSEQAMKDLATTVLGKVP